MDDLEECDLPEEVLREGYEMSDVDFKLDLGDYLDHTFYGSVWFGYNDEGFDYLGSVEEYEDFEGYDYVIMLHKRESKDYKGRPDVIPWHDEKKIQAFEESLRNNSFKV